jgi:hypothetical protein
MAEIASTTRALYGELVGSGDWSLSASQLQYAVRGGLGPLEDAPDPAAHWRTLSSLAAGDSRRIPTSDGAAIELAVNGYPCARLGFAVRRFIAADDPPSHPEEVAEEFMAAARAPGQDKPYGARLAERMLEGAVARPGTTGEDAELERLGQAQAVAASFSEVAEGASPAASIDPDDVAQVFGMPRELVRVYLPAFEETFGSETVLGNVDSLVDSADVDRLATAVRVAAAVLSLFEQTVVPMGSAVARWRWIAQIAPLMLALPQLHGAVVAQAGGADLAANLPSMFAGETRQLAAVREAIGALSAGPVDGSAATMPLEEATSQR